jgi:hypothetical protein
MWTNKRIAHIDSISGGVDDLTGPAVAAVYGAWSLDGTSMAYAAAPDAGIVEGLGMLLLVDGAAADRDFIRRVQQTLAQRHLWLIDAATSAQRQLTDDSRYRDERPLWASDGEHILFARIDANDQPSLWMLELATGVPEPVVEIVPCQSNDGVCYRSSLDEETAGPFWFGYYGHVHWPVYYDWWQPGQPQR